MPLISIVIATYNSKNVILRAVESCLKQSFDDFEVIIVDGASTDGTVDIIKNINNPKITIISEPDNGIYEAWNKGVRLAKGDWIVPLGSDDYFWDNDVFKKIAPYLKEDDKLFKYGDVAVVDAEGKHLRTRHLSAKEAFKRTRKSMPINHCFYNRIVFENDLFDENFKISGDFDFVAKHRRAENFKHMPVGIISAFSEGGVSSNPFNDLHDEEVFKIRLKNKFYLEALIIKIKHFLKKLLVLFFGKENTLKIAKIYRKIRKR